MSDDNEHESHVLYENRIIDWRNEDLSLARFGDVYATVKHTPSDFWALVGKTLTDAKARPGPDTAFAVTLSQRQLASMQLIKLVMRLWADETVSDTDGQRIIDGWDASIPQKDAQQNTTN